jgi:hypothetical protein
MMLLTDEGVSTAHRAKLAYVYIRQSSPGQVRHGSGFMSSTMILANPGGPAVIVTVSRL